MRMKSLVNLFNTNIFILSLENKFNFEVRPNASNGLWLMFLLPTALLISSLKHSTVLSNTYKLLPIFSIGLILTSIYIIQGLKKEEYVKFYQLWFFLPISILFYIFLNSGFLFSLYSGCFCTVLYCQIYLFVLRMFPKSFTLGEAGLTSQAVVIHLYTTLPYFYHCMEHTIFTTVQTSTIIIQMELLGIMFLGCFLIYFDIRKTVPVYTSTFIILLLTVLIPLHIILQRSPFIWIVGLLIEDIPTIKMVLYWVLCSCLAALVVLRQGNIGDQASSSQRKIFHLLAVAVYIPGLIYECNLLYLGSGILLGIFFILEILRNLSLPPLGNLLQASFMALRDSKDAGILAVTPIYLLTGFTLPLWIHPSPCDVTDSSLFSFIPLLSGILSVGIGDTAASVFGSRYGHFFYRDSKKTIDGTVASVICQFLTIFILFRLGCIINMDLLLTLRITVAIVFTAIVEAKTDQIDNAILPLIMYIILI